MTAIWENSGDGWRLLPASGFPDEETLHSLVEDAPHVLPLSGSPHLTIVGREVALGGGFADLVAVEPSGRLVILEIKLQRNPEARRSVIAQILSYAAALYGVSRETVEGELLAGHLARRGFESLSGAVASSGFDGLTDPVEFSTGLDECLAAGAFRLVLVLDDAPPDLVRLVAYLEAKTDGLVIDLVVVAAHETGETSLLVPRRIEPEREKREVAARESRPVATNRVTRGASDFRAAIADEPAERQELLSAVCDWAEGLEVDDLASLATTNDLRGWKVLRVLVPGRDVGIVTLWSRGHPVQVWRSVLERLAPESLAAVEEALGWELPMSGSRSTSDITPELLAALTDAYRRASSLTRVT